MAGPYICEIFFEENVGSRAAGWSEVHYDIGAGTLPAALADLTLLATARGMLLGAGVEITYLRVSDINIFRDSQVVSGIANQYALTVSRTGNATVIPVQSGAPIGAVAPPLYSNALQTGVPAGQLIGLLADQPEVGLLVRLEAGTPYQHRRSLLLRGIPDGVTVTTTWSELMTSGKWGFRVLNTDAVANPTLAITGFAVDPVSHRVTVTAPGAAIPVGHQVRIAGVKIAAPNGRTIGLGDICTVLTNAAGAYTFISTNPNSPFVDSQILALNQILALGTMRDQLHTTVPYNNVVPRIWSSRKVGLPFDPYRGRRKKRA